MTFHSFLLEVERVDRELKVKLHELENKGTDKPVASARAKLPCSVCSKTYVRRKYLIEHQRIHPELYCRQCDKSFDDAGSRKRHRCSNDTSGDDAGGDYIKDNFVKFEGNNTKSYTDFYVSRCMLRAKFVTKWIGNAVRLFSTISYVTFKISFDFQQD